MEREGLRELDRKIGAFVAQTERGGEGKERGASWDI